MPAVVAAAGLLLAGCTTAQAPPADQQRATPAPPTARPQVRTTPRTNQTPPALARGEQLYTQHCARCHGERGSGTATGPTFLSPIYAPDHHSDQAFIMAVQQGVRPHHWNFGPMPQIPGLSNDEVRQIIAYVRWFQGLTD